VKRFVLFLLAMVVSLHAYGPYPQPVGYQQQVAQPMVAQPRYAQPAYPAQPAYQQRAMPRAAYPAQPVYRAPMAQPAYPQQMAQAPAPVAQAKPAPAPKAAPRVVEAPKPKVIVKKPKAPRYVPLYITHSNNPTGNLNAMLIFLADQLERNVDSKYFSQPTIVTTFANLDNLKKTSSFGRLLAESLTHELQVRKWRVVEIRMAKSIIMNKSGEFSMTRETNKIRGAHKVRAVVTGTYSFTDDCVVVNAKVLNVDTGIILSSGQISIPLDSLNGMMYDDVNPRVMRIKGE
jgi:TolB-like protein